MNLFQGLFDTTTTQTMTLANFLICMIAALAIGIFLAFVHSWHGRSTRSFLLTLTLLPSAVCMIILMGNGNLGTGVAVASAFSLVRFRSAPGTVKEIGSLFLAMAVGLAVGMGYIGYAVLFALVTGLFLMLATALTERKPRAAKEKILRITIPEDLNYTDVFDDLMEKYTTRSEMTNVKTSNLGSLYKLTYEITLKDTNLEKEFLDELRCRNGNLEISIGRQETSVTEL